MPILLCSLMDYSSSTCTVPFPLLLMEVEVDDVLQDLLEDDLDLTTRQLGHDVCQILDGLRLDSIVLGLDLLHVGLSDLCCCFFIGVEVDVTGEYEFAEPFGRHFHVVWIIVTHLVDEDVQLLLAYFCHVPLLLLYLTAGSNKNLSIYQLGSKIA